MNARILAGALAIAMVWGFTPGATAGGTFSTALQSQSIAMTPVSGGSGMPVLGSPLAFSKFDPTLGNLEGVALSFTATIRNDFILTFASTPTPTAIYVATTEAADPGVLANPTLAQQLADGPSIELRGPAGSTLFGGPATTMPVDVVSITASSGTYSSMDAIADPHYIAPDQATFTLSQTINTTNPGLLSAFVGPGTIDLPVLAVAHSSFYSNSGNGGGAVLTDAGATVTIQYLYTPTFSAFVVPEPSGLLLLGLGISLLAGPGLMARRRARAAGRDGLV